MLHSIRQESGGEFYGWGVAGVLAPPGGGGVWGGCGCGRRKGKEEGVGETPAMGDEVGVACSLRLEDGVSLCWRKKRKKLILGVANILW